LGWLSFFTDAFRAEPTERPPDSDDFWYTHLQRSTSGQQVTAESAMGIAAVYAAVRLIAETLAYIPLPIYRRIPNSDGDKIRARDHPLFDLLNHSPNPNQTAMEFKEMMTGHVLMRGNAYAEIVPGRRGAVNELWPLHPARMQVFVNPDKSLLYKYQMRNGGTRIYFANEIFHLRGLSTDGAVGLSPVSVHRETFGMAQATQDMGAKFFRNDAAPGGLLSTPDRLGTDTRHSLENDWNRRYGSGGE